MLASIKTSGKALQPGTRHVGSGNLALPVLRF
jgi:hypothetical protein